MVSERTRHGLHEAARTTMGEEAADALMEMLPPVGWADVATKHDLDVRFELQDARFEARMAQFEARFMDELRKQTMRFWTGLVLTAGVALGIVEGLGRIG